MFKAIIIRILYIPTDTESGSPSSFLTMFMSHYIVVQNMWSVVFISQQTNCHIESIYRFIFLMLFEKVTLKFQCVYKKVAIKRVHLWAKSGADMV